MIMVVHHGFANFTKVEVALRAHIANLFSAREYDGLAHSKPARTVILVFLSPNELVVQYRTCARVCSDIHTWLRQFSVVCASWSIMQEFLEIIEHS